MRPIAMRGGTHTSAGKTWRVPLFAPPTDPRRVAELLGSVLCGEATGCTVRYPGLATASW